MNNVLGLDGKPKQPTSPVYHVRLCLVGSDDIDIKNWSKEKINIKEYQAQSAKVLFTDNNFHDEKLNQNFKQIVFMFYNKTISKIRCVSHILFLILNYS